MRSAEPPHESQGHQGIVSEALGIGKDLVKSLPPAFLLLVLINLAFLGMIMWFLNSQLSQRAEFVSKLVDRCMEIALHAPSPSQ